ncbi:hypothetical protein [Methanosphaera sp. WGK6]|uniref:hypothetical protein n=1 Tax=Methanosphaera sp. WGK6 TaxID=1561964 RepID=UPI0018E915DA|nr:hypothetical protein [Methanosphaera sp. WGK6]
MVQSVVIFSEIIPTILAVSGLYFLFSGVLDNKRTYTIAGIGLFVLAVFVPFLILGSII